MRFGRPREKSGLSSTTQTAFAHFSLNPHYYPPIFQVSHCCFYECAVHIQMQKKCLVFFTSVINRGLHKIAFRAGAQPRGKIGIFPRPPPRNGKKFPSACIKKSKIMLFLVPLFIKMSNTKLLSYNNHTSHKRVK